MNATFLRKTFELAKASVSHGNHPFGALLVLDGKIVGEAQNTVTSDGDITGHAELNLISKYHSLIDPSDISRVILYSSTEPCAMCAGAIVWSGIRKVVFGCSSKLLNQIAKGHFTIPTKILLSYSSEKYDVEGPCLEEEASDLHRGYWPNTI